MPPVWCNSSISFWKEAYVKALGKGFSASPFKTSTVRLRDHIKGGIHVPPDVIFKGSEISGEPSDGLKNPSSDWHFVLLELFGSHYAAVCIEQDTINGVSYLLFAGKWSIPINLTLQKTIPFVEDEYIVVVCSEDSELFPISSRIVILNVFRNQEFSVGKTVDRSCFYWIV